MKRFKLNLQVDPDNKHLGSELSKSLNLNWDKITFILRMKLNIKLHYLTVKYHGISSPLYKLLYKYIKNLMSK